MSDPTFMQRAQAKPGIFPFAVAITVLNVLGHSWLGFEQAWATPFVALAAAYASEISIELAIMGWAKARFRGGWSLGGQLLLEHVQRIAPPEATSYVLFTGHQSHDNIRMYKKAGFRLRADLERCLCTPLEIGRWRRGTLFPNPWPRP